MNPLASFIFNKASSALSGIIVDMVSNQTKAVNQAELERKVSQLVAEEIKKYHLRPQYEELKKTTAEICNEVKRLSSITRTYTRIDLIKSQVRIALRRTTDINDYTIENYILLEIAYQNISEVNVYGLDSSNLCKAQLIMTIDWKDNNLQIANGKATVVITEDGGTWKNNTAIELRETISLFIDYAEAHNLKAKCHIRYATGVNHEQSDRVLGLVNLKPIKWKDKANGFEFDIPEIREFRVGFSCVD
jgi:hypothetical protein